MKKDETPIFHQAVDSFQERLLRYAGKFVGDSETAREIVQETFLRFWKQPPSKVENHVAPWLFHVCRNLCIERQRKAQRMNASQLETWQLIDQESVESDAFDQLEKKDRFALAVRLMRDLPPKHQELLILKFQNGFSYKQIALITGMSTSHVGKVLHEVLTVLKKQIAKDHERKESQRGEK